MATALVIVDSVQKARTIEAQMPGEVQTLALNAVPVKATLVPPADSLKRERPRFSFSPLPEGKEFFQALQNAQTMDIYLAFDSDQRGEYWSWLVNEYLLADTSGAKSARRLHLVGLNREELEESFRLVEPVQSDKAVAYYIRFLFAAHLVRHLKRLIGTTTGPQGLPLTINSLTTLFLLAEREAEIRAFTPAVKWQVRVRLDSGHGEFDARLEEAYGITEDGYMRDGAKSKEAIALFRDTPFQVSEFEREEIAIQSPAPFRMMELLEEAFAVYKLHPRQVVEAVSRLYQGVEVQGVTVGLVSSFALLENLDARKLCAKLRLQVEKMFGAAALAPEGAHEDLRGAVVPLRPEMSPAAVAGALSPAEQQVYGLIHARALASQMPEATGAVIDAIFSAGEGCLFKASGRVLADKGFLAAYAGHQFRELLDSSPLANLEAGQQVRAAQIIPEQTSGFPPEYYTFEGLATDLNDFAMPFDIPTLLMLQSMIDTDYLALMPNATWRCKENTAKLINVMNKAFPSMRSINLSAYFEQTVNEVVSGRKPLAFALQQFDQTLMMQGNVLVKVKVPVTPRARLKTSRSIIKTPAGEPLAPPVSAGAPLSSTTEQEAAAPEEITAPVVEIPAEQILEPAAEEPVIEEAVAEEASAETAPTAPLMEQTVCSGEEALSEEAETQAEDSGQAAADAAAATQELFAKAATEIEAPPEESAPAPVPAAGPVKPCPECGRPLLLKEDRFGKYWSCSGHPDCRHSESHEKETALAMACPLCQVGSVVTKRTPTGKLFYVCPEQNCEFMAWSKPFPLACQVCDSPFLVEKKNLAGKVFLRCPRAGCNFMQPLPGDEDVGGLLASDQPKKKKVLVRRVKGGGSGGGRKVRVVRRKK